MNRTDVNSMWNLSWQMDLKISLSSTNNNNHHHRRRPPAPPADRDSIKKSKDDENNNFQLVTNRRIIRYSKRVCLQMLTSTTLIAGVSRNWLTRFFFNSPTWRIFGGRMRMCVRVSTRTWKFPVCISFSPIHE
jgi:hypothetical protein